MSPQYMFCMSVIVGLSMVELIFLAIRASYSLAVRTMRARGIWGGAKPQLENKKIILVPQNDKILNTDTK